MRSTTQRVSRLALQALNYTNQGVVLSDPNQPDNPIIYANPAFEVLTGYSQEEIIGNNCRFLQGSNSDKATISKMRTAIGQSQHCRVEIINYRKDGTEFWNELSISPVYSEAGKLELFIGIQQDITDRVFAFQSLQQDSQLYRDYSAIRDDQKIRQRTLDDRIDDLLRQAGMHRTG